jgi:hypothetical protein
MVYTNRRQAISGFKDAEEATMDPRLNLAMMDRHEADIRRARTARARHRWPDDGLPARNGRKQRPSALHPTAILASLLTER